MTVMGNVRDAVRRFSDRPFANEAAALVLLVAAMQLLPRGMRLSSLLGGGVAAAPLALNAVGMILVYRSNRFINLAQLQIGIFAAVLFSGLVRGRVLLLAVHDVCASCAPVEPGGVADKVNMAIAGVVAMVVAMALSLLVYVIVIRRFARSPVLVPTIVSLFVAQSLSGVQGSVGEWLVDPKAIERGTALAQIEPPVDVSWTIDFFPLHVLHVAFMMVAVGAVAGVWLYLRRSDTGAAVRAAAENPQRAATVGVDVAAVTARVWVLAGALSGLAAIIPVMSGGGAGGGADATGIPVATLVMLLTVLVVARFAHLWMALAAAMVLSVLQSAVQVSYSSQAPLNVLFVFLVGGLLLVQRERTTRATREDFSGLDVSRELRPIPRELRDLPKVRSYVRGGWVVAAVVLLGLPWALPAAKAALVVDSFILVLVGLSILVLTGWAGQVSMGQFGFAAIGAWAAAVSGWPFPLALMLAAVAGAVAAVVVGLPALKLKGLSLAISTLAFAVSAHAIFIDSRYLGGALPDRMPTPSLLGLDLRGERAAYYLTLVMIAGACAMVLALRRSRTGRVLIALRSNEAAAQSFGINPLRARLVAFSVSGAIAAVAGALLAFHVGRVAPDAYLADRSLVVFLYTVVGGLGGIAGPILGMGFYAAVTYFFTGNALVEYAGASTGAVLLMLVAPGGLAQLVYAARDSMLLRLAFRLRIPVPSLMGDRGAAIAMERAPLDEKRTAPRRPGDLVPLRYKPAGQWALARHGESNGIKERVGD